MIQDESSKGYSQHLLIPLEAVLQVKDEEEEGDSLSNLST